MYIASNIKYLRAKQKLTQVGLAEKLDKTSAAISDYEKGKSLPPLDVAFRISEFFQVDIDDLVGKDLQKVDMFNEEGFQYQTDSSYKFKYEQLLKEFETLERLSRLQEQRLAELEREIREHAPGLAGRLEL